VVTQQNYSKAKNEVLVSEKRARIIDAASKLFSQKGYHRTTMRNISEESGIELSYLYKFISSKDDILFLFHEHVHSKYAPLYKMIESSKGEDPAVLMKNILVMILRILRQIPSEILTMYSESRHLEKSSLKIVLQKETQMITIIEDLVKRGIECGKFKVNDSFFAANIIQYLITIECIRGWSFKKNYSSKSIEDSIINFIMAGLGSGRKIVSNREANLQSNP